MRRDVIGWDVVGAHGGLFCFFLEAIECPLFDDREEYVPSKYVSFDRILLLEHFVN